MPVLVKFATSFGVDVSMVGVLFTAFAGSQIISSLWMSACSQKIGKKNMLLISLLGSSVGFLLQALATSFVQLLLARIFAGLVSGTAPVAFAYLSDLYKPEDRAKPLGRMAAVVAGVFAVGPLIGGGLARLGLSIPFFAAALWSLLGFCLSASQLQEPSEIKLLDPDQLYMDLRSLALTKKDNKKQNSAKTALASAVPDILGPRAGPSAAATSTPALAPGLSPAAIATTGRVHGQVLLMGLVNCLNMVSCMTMVVMIAPLLSSPQFEAIGIDSTDVQAQVQCDAQCKVCGVGWGGVK
jgi:MFS family permease